MKDEGSTMLTKDLLSFKIQKKNISANLIEATDQDVLEVANKIISFFKNNLNHSYESLEKRLADHQPISKNSQIYFGFKKILFDLCTFEEVCEENTYEKRCKLIKNAQFLRQEKHFENMRAFQESFARQENKQFSSIAETLYSDLPERKTLTKLPIISAQDLIHRYNCAQIQGLLLRSSDVKIELKHSSISEKRYLFKQLKFHRLLPEVHKDIDKQLIFSINGPLSLFSQQQTYGLRIANFFPHLLNTKHWELSAQVNIKNKDAKLFISDQCKIESHYKSTQPYIPKEFSELISNFNKKSSTWKVSSGQNFLHIGRQSYCFADFLFTNKTNKDIHLEMFHRWHSSQLVDRIKTIKDRDDCPLILGICKQLKNKKELQPLINDSVKVKKFYYNDFPTSSSLLRFINETIK